MEIGVIFPQTEIEADPGAIRDFAQAAEDLGYDHIFIADHVLGADPSYHQHPSLGTYNHRSVVHESLVLMGFLSAITQRVGLTTGILILPQRQTALVAIGVGWNAVEFEALDENFHNRGRRSAEQIEVMRALWTQEVVDYHGRWHDITHAGINPLPVQRPIPVWIGGGSSADARLSEVVLRRIAAIADGWCPNITTDDAGRATVEKVHGFAREVGRDPSTLGLDGRIRAADKQPEEWLDEVKAWEEMGATHLSIETRRGGLTTAEEHIEAIRQFREALEIVA